jgi:uncharacterized protein (TIGR03083 family)
MNRTSAAMTEDDIRAAVEAERLGLSDFLDTLGPSDWEVRSLCSAWTVREVVAHLTIPTRATVPFVIRGAIRARGDVHRMFAMQARERAAAFTPAQLVAQLRETAGSRRRMPMSAPMDPLTDILVHGQDIARPLGRSRPMPAGLAVAGLEFVLPNAFHGAPKRLAGLRLVATDADWPGSDGAQEIRGTAGDLLLAAMGRAAALAGLSGAGVDVLRRRLN